MYRLGKYFFTCSGFAGQQNCCVCGSHFTSQIYRLLNGFRLADDLIKRVFVAQLLFEKPNTFGQIYFLNSPIQ